MEDTKDKIECVGSLLIHSHDVQELDSDHIPSPMPSVETLKKRPTVGTLLVATNTITNNTTETDPSQTKDKDEKGSSLMRRITEICQVPDPDDTGYDEWMQ